jgi:hypothetical protein
MILEKTGELTYIRQIEGLCILTGRLYNGGSYTILVACLPSWFFGNIFPAGNRVLFPGGGSTLV